MSLDRRSFLHSGAVAAAALGLGPAWPSAGRAAAPTATEALRPLSGMVVGWVRVDLNGGASIRLAHQRDPDAAPVEIAVRDSPADKEGADRGNGSLLSWGRQADGFAADVVARSWRVPGEGWRIEPGRIVCLADGRSVGYRVWVDVM